MLAPAVCHDHACRPYVQRHRCMPCGGSTPRSTTPMTSCWWTPPQSGCRAQTSSRPSRPSLPPPTALLWPMPGRTLTQNVCLSFRIHALSVCLLCRIQALSVCLLCRTQALFVCLSVCLSVCMSVCHIVFRYCLSACLSVCQSLMSDLDTVCLSVYLCF